MALPERPAMSVEEYLRLDRTSIEMRHEYIDGYVRMLAGGTVNHSQIAINVASILYGLLRRSPCRVLYSNVRVRLSETRYVYPDITGSCDKNDWQEQADIIHAPSLVVEVLSPTTEKYDRGRKFAYYQKCSTIQEYMLIDAQYQGVEIFRRKGEMWLYRRFEPDQRVELDSLGIDFPVASLYEHVKIPLAEE